MEKPLSAPMRELMDGVLDAHFISNLEQKLEKTQLKRVDSETIDKLIPTDTKAESVLSKDEEESHSYLIKDGEVTNALEPLNVAGNIYTSLKNILRMGNDSKLGPFGVKTPSIVLDGLTITG